MIEISGELWDQAQVHWNEIKRGKKVFCAKLLISFFSQTVWSCNCEEAIHVNFGSNYLITVFFYIFFSCELLCIGNAFRISIRPITGGSTVHCDYISCRSNLGTSNNARINQWVVLLSFHLVFNMFSFLFASFFFAVFSHFCCCCSSHVLPCFVFLSKFYSQYTYYSSLS